MRAINFRTLFKVPLLYSTQQYSRFCSIPESKIEEEELKLREFEQFFTENDIGTNSSYRDMATAFEREWNSLVTEQSRVQIEYIEAELHETTKKKLDFLIKEVKSLSNSERTYFNHLFIEKSIEMDGINPLAIDVKSPQFQSFSKEEK